MGNPALVFPRPSARVAVGPLLGNACATPEEHELARAACTSTRIRGLGEDFYYGVLEEHHEPYDDTRWRDIPPCQVVDLPICDCANDWDILALTPCIAGTAGPDGWPQDFHDNWCAQRGAGLLDTDYCPGSTVPAAPGCLQTGERSGLGYCSVYGYQGPNAYANALCWNAIQSGLLARMLALPDCAAATPTPTYQAPPPAPFVPPPPPPVTVPAHDPETRRSSMMLPGLILLLVGAGSAAYYVSQRKRKR